MRPLLSLTCTAAVAIVSLAPRLEAALTNTFSFSSIDLDVPDGNPSGAADVQNVSSSIASLTAVNVSFTISGDYNGDLYAYLQHDSGLAVLLNRVGRTAGNSYGYDDSGFIITLSDSASDDVHTYRDILTPSSGSPLTGTWLPDARSADPGSVLDTSPRDAKLDAFQSQSGNGDWTLFVADLEYGGSSTLNSWSLELIGTAIPEPIHIGLGLFGALFVGIRSLAWLRARKR